MSGKVTTARWIVRLALLGAAVLLGAGGPIPYLLSRVFPSLSPLVAIASVLAQRWWYLGFFWGIAPAVLLALGFWKGRFFCRWICPTGTLYSIPSRWNLRKKLLKVRLGGILFWTIIAGSLVGAPLVLFVDPLSTFNRIAPLVSGTYTIASLVPGLLIPLMLLLGLFQPMIWCTHICPLGYLFGFTRLLRTEPVKGFDANRRRIAMGIFIGVPAGLLMRKYLLVERKEASVPILPPGAKDLENFAATCTRCYACVNVCPTEIIKVRGLSGRALGQLFQPQIEYPLGEINTDRGFCPEPCTKCSQVCPSGAMRPLTLRAKRQRKIGTARVIPEACLAWADSEYCMVCQEYCPYSAIDSDYSPSGIPRPVVKDETCRGCGICQVACPAIRSGKAIIVHGIAKQTQIRDDYANLYEGT